MQRRLIQTEEYYKLFYSVRKETPHKHVKVAAARKFLSSVYIIDTTCFDECFLFHMITGRHYFLIQISHYSGLVHVVLLSSLKQVFWKKSAFYILYLHNNITMLLIPNKGLKYSFYFLNILNKIYFFIFLFQFVNVSQLFLSMEFLKLKGSLKTCFFLKAGIIQMFMMRISF